jgi:aspartyl-tRNA(Asn)/glutamyl-tRNA(Gln) amidotransferase subunit B
VKFEEERQRQALAAGQPLTQETRHWDENKGHTSPLRSKEFAFDYRYFPEPDLSPLEPDAEWIEKLRAELPELPAARRRRLEDEFGLEPRQAALIGGGAGSARFFEEAASLGADPRAVANWISGDLAAHLNEARIELEQSKITAKHIADLVGLVSEGAISSAGAKAALAEAFASGDPIDAIVEAKGLRQVSDAGALEEVIDEVIAENPGPVAQFTGGKEGALNALVGQVMKKTKGSANPQVAADLLRRRLTS